MSITRPRTGPADGSARLVGFLVAFLIVLTLTVIAVSALTSAPGG